MSLPDLRALAAHHESQANACTQAALGMGDCPMASTFLEQATQHRDWATGLNSLADAFEPLLQVITE